MPDYKLIAFDMDGTLLRSDKTISTDTLDAVHKAVKAGKYAAIATGRPVAEMRPYFDSGILKDFHYAVLESGSLIYDLREHNILDRHTIDVSCVPAILDAADQEDVMLHAMMNGNAYVDKNDLPRMAYYGMGQYRPLFEKVETKVPDIRGFIREHAGEFEKINLYHVSREASIRSSSRLKEIPAEKIFAETTSLEISPSGIDKGTGLKSLCGLVHVPITSTIAVGDADNDIPMIHAAGLAVAMGNANENVKRYAEVVVADNDHDGCAEAIRKYLISEVS